MSILSDLVIIFDAMNLPVETGTFSSIAPDEYVVLTPLSDVFEHFADDEPGFETQEARISLFSKSNYIAVKNTLVRALVQAGFSIIDRRYLGYEDDTKYHHLAIDLAKLYEF